MKPADGAEFRMAGNNWITHVEHNEDGGHMWVECDGCGATNSGGEDAIIQHVCWFDVPNNVAALAAHLAAEGYDATEVAAAVEKPWHYADEATEAGVR